MLTLASVRDGLRLGLKKSILSSPLSNTARNCGGDWQNRGTRRRRRTQESCGQPDQGLYTSDLALHGSQNFVDFLFVQYILAFSWLLKYSFENEIFRGCSLKFWEVVLDPALSVTNFIGEGR
jgi:hypothetical protein